MHGFLLQRHGGPEVLEWLEIPEPEPASDEVIVGVKACALNHLDLWVRKGVEGHTFPLPLIPGCEVAGIVEICGTAVRDLAVGQPVLVAPGVSCGLCDRCVAGEDMLCRDYGILGEHRNGGCAERVAVPRRNILPLPNGLSFVEAASLPLVFLTAWHMLVARARLQPLEDVLLHAAGSGVTSAGIQIARHLGARSILVTAGSDAKLERARALGATHTINYTTQDFVREVRTITGRKGVEVVFEHVGGETFERSISALAWGGRLVLCGATTGHLATVNLRQIFFKSLSILGSTMGSLAELRHLMRLVEAGELKPVVDRTYPMQQIRDAQSALERREAFGKIVLTLGEQLLPHRSGKAQQEEV